MADYDLTTGASGAKYIDASDLPGGVAGTESLALVQLVNNAKLLDDAVTGAAFVARDLAHFIASDTGAFSMSYTVTWGEHFDALGNYSVQADQPAGAGNCVQVANAGDYRVSASFSVDRTVAASGYIGIVPYHKPSGGSWTSLATVVFPKQGFTAATLEVQVTIEYVFTGLGADERIAFVLTSSQSANWSFHAQPSCTLTVERVG